MTDPSTHGDREGARPGRSRVLAAVGVVVVVIGLGALLGVVARGEGEGGSSDSPPSRSAGTTAPLGSSTLGRGFGTEVRGRTPLRGFSEVAATITAGDGTTCQVCLLAATTAAQRERGLMEVRDRTLGGYDGMLFTYDAPITGAFWMRNTPMPLSIAYFDGHRTLVSATDMAPCTDSPTCRSYPAEGAFQYALEVPKGRLDDVGVVGRATIAITATRCPLAH